MRIDVYNIDVYNIMNYNVHKKSLGAALEDHPETAIGSEYDSPCGYGGLEICFFQTVVPWLHCIGSYSRCWY